MNPRSLSAAAALAAALATLPASAQSRPDEDALFGGGQQEQPPTPASAAQPPATPEKTPPSSRPSEDSLFGGPSEGEQPSGDAPTPSGTVNPSAPPAQPPGVDQAGREETRDEQALSGTPTQEALGSEEHAEDPLKIGGQFYLRALAQGSEGVSFGSTTFSAPTLVDGYFDARPTDRLRGMVVGRLTFDPTLSSQGTGFLGTNPGDGSPNTPSVAVPPNPRVLLDQAWLRFDIARTVFVTAGKQHVKWGTSRFWNPTDFLSPQRRDPLAIFDARTGASMVKLHVPWEDKGWNFYGIALLDNAGPSSTLGRIGGAARAEVVLGQAEMGASAVLQRGRKPRFGLDLSSALGPLDVYAEAALRKGSDTPLYRLPEGITFEQLIEQAQGLEIDSLDDLRQLPIESYFPEGLTPQVSGGFTYTFAYNENDTATVGVEYFYNSTGYSTSIAYPYLIAQGQYQPFYVGKHYGGLYTVLAGPGSWDKTSFILSNLGNLSDRSFTSRLDVLHRALSYLSIEAYVAVNYGTKGGEFRFALDYPPFEVNGRPLLPAPIVQVGGGLRINL
ncbi:hypothetical protein [Hyalangium rubrum]|uniref:Porin n=1 Tax=Hyalangium rubrum TaxID=3103134 RepID=A0ABU5H0B2_9BACT|nr:hypothetical protein [Hyalangium sp. s54d21]MDY7225550.1 hypothetical protein [Hyalangium sp. s54d21]